VKHRLRPQRSLSRLHGIQDRHDQQEQGDRRLHTQHGRVQVLGDVVDHHVHVRARETADELGKRERSDEVAR
jgi:hypothetical protein